MHVTRRKNLFNLVNNEHVPLSYSMHKLISYRRKKLGAKLFCLSQGELMLIYMHVTWRKNWFSLVNNEHVALSSSAHKRIGSRRKKLGTNILSFIGWIDANIYACYLTEKLI